MQSAECNFCRRGNEANQYCGKLHVETIAARTKPIAAHHKCMQYSACLVQRKTKAFGGFKLNDVVQEIHRGRRLTCNICKNNQNRKGKWTGATAGCAVKGCRKSFHYYCAKNSKVALTKRYVVRNLKKNRDEVWYRVFCNKAHEKAYKENIKDYADANKDLSDEEDEEEEIDNDDEANDSDCGGASDDQDEEERNDDDDDDDDGGGGGGGDDDNDMSDGNSDKSSMLLSEYTIGGNRMEIEENFKDIEVCYDANCSSDSDIDLVSRHSKSKKRTPRIVSDNSDSGDSESIERRVDANKQTRRINKARRQNQTSNHGSEKRSKVDHYPDTTLVITSKINISLLERNKIQKLSEHADVMFWLDRASFLTEEQIPFLINDISQRICEKQYEAALTLLTDENHLKSHLAAQENTISLYQCKDSNFEFLFNKVRSNLSKKGNNCSHCCLKDVKNVKALMISLDDIIDPNQRARKLFGVGLTEFHQWTPSTFRHKHISGSREDQEREIQQITRWINRRSDSILKVVLKPDDVALLTLDGSVIETLASSLKAINNQDPEGHDERKSVMVVIFRCMDPKVVNYQLYVRKYMSHLIRERPDNIKRLMFLLNFHLLKNKSTREDIIPDDVNNMCEETLICSANDPGEKTVDCMVIDVTLKEKAGNKRHKGANLLEPVVMLEHLDTRSLRAARKRRFEKK